jgi:hypothetical protein
MVFIVKTGHSDVNNVLPIKIVPAMDSDGF